MGQAPLKLSHIGGIARMTNLSSALRRAKGVVSSDASAAGVGNNGNGGGGGGGGSVSGGTVTASGSAVQIADDRLRSASVRFGEFRSRLKRIDASLRIHHDNLRRADASRTAVVRALADAGAGTPLGELVGSMSEAGDEAAEAEAVREDKCPSYAGLHCAVKGARGPQLVKYREEAIAYVQEWEKTVATRIKVELRNVGRLHREWMRYEKKVEGLHSAMDKKRQKKGNDYSPSEKELEKVSRNESKLRTAKKDYRRNLVSVTLLVEEVTDRGWKDLMPLVIRLIEYDVETSHTTIMADFVHRLNQVKEEMKDIGHRHEMDYRTMRDGRLRVLLEEDAVEFVDPVHMQDMESVGTTLRSPVNVIEVTQLQDFHETFDTPLHTNATPGGLGLPLPRPQTHGGGGGGGGGGTASNSSEDDDDEDSLDDLGEGAPQDAQDPARAPPSAPPADLMSRGGATLATPPEERPDPEAPVSAPSFDEDDNRLRRAEPPDLPANGDDGDGAEERARPDRVGANPNNNRGGGAGVRHLEQYEVDDTGTVRYPTSIYIDSANDDVTALTPFPDLVSI